MKKILISIVLLAVSLGASAQFSGGFMAGINGSQVDGDNYAGYYKLGLNLGGMVSFPFSSNFSGSMEFLFTQKGSEAKPLPPDAATAGYAPTQMLFRVNYVEIPLLINFRNKSINTNTQGLGNLTLTAGLSIAKLISDTVIEPPIDRPDELYPGNTFFFPRIIHSYDFNGVLGLGYNLTPHWQVQFRFTYSLLQFGASDNSMQINHGLFNNVLTFRMAYILTGKGQSK
jgi:hypothetical protein